MKSLTHIIFENNKNIHNDKNKKERILSFLSFLIVFVFLSSIMTIGSIVITKRLKEINQQHLFINILLFLNFIILFAKGVLEGINVLYFSKDLKTLLRMPIKPKDILNAKILNMIYSEYQMEFIMLGIPMIVYGILMELGIAFYFYMAIVLIVIPIIPIMITSLIVAIIMRFTNFIKNKSQLMYIAIILSLFLVGVILSIFNGNLGGYETAIQTNKMIENISNNFILIKPIMNILIQYNNIIGFKNLIIYIIENILCYVIVLNIISKIYLKGTIGVTVNSNKSKKSNKELAISDFKLKKPKEAYFLKEIRLIVRSPIFFIECFIMPIVYAISLIVGSIVLGNMTNIANLIRNVFNTSYGISIGIIISLLLYMMNFSSIIAVSKEGKNAVLIKYLPISLNRQFNLKIRLGVILNSISAIGTTIFIYFLTKDLLLSIMLFVGLELINIIYEKYKILIDLRRPQIKWDNEYTMMKQNTNVMYELFYTIIVSFIIVALSFFLTSARVYIGILIICCIIINVAINYYVNKNERKLFGKIY